MYKKKYYFATVRTAKKLSDVQRIVILSDVPGEGVCDTHLCIVTGSSNLKKMNGYKITHLR